MNEQILKQIGELDVPDEVALGWVNEWNPIIRVDRTVKPTYPDFVKEVKHPELELAGPGEFDVRKLDRWLHPKQVSGYATGNEIYEKLIAEKLFEGCFNLADLGAIQARGSMFYRKHFAGLVLPAWASVVLDRFGGLSVPYLCEDGGTVLRHWFWLGSNFDSRGPALRRAS